MKKRFFSILRIAVSILFMIILLYIMRDKYDEIAARLKTTNLALLSLAVLAFLGAIAIASLRLKLIIKAQEFSVTFLEALSLTLIGYFFNNFLPTSIGGDVVKAYHLAKHTDERMGSFASVFVDRIIGLFTMIFMAFAALFFVRSGALDKRMVYLIYLMAGLSALAIIFMTNRNFAKVFSVFMVFLRPIEETLKRAYNVIHKYKHHKILIYQSLLISIVSQMLFFLSLAILIYSIGSRVTIMDILLRVPIISTLSLLPSLNGLGIREGSMVLLFGSLIGRENAFAVSILWLLVLFITSIAGGIIYGLSPQFKIRLEEEEHRED